VSLLKITFILISFFVYPFLFSQEHSANNNSPKTEDSPQEDLPAPLKNQEILNENSNTKSLENLDDLPNWNSNPVSEYPRPIDEDLKQHFALSYYEPLYALIGNPTSRVNFSFRYEAWHNFPLFLGYVQNIFWLLNKHSAPFLDADFNPRLFYRLDLSYDDNEDYLDLIGYEHKSNGKGGNDSRAMDGAGAKLSKRWEYKNWALQSTLKGYWRYKLSRKNMDYDDFVGPFTMGLSATRFSYGWIKRSEFSYHLYSSGKWGQDLSRLSHEITLSLRFFGEKWLPSFYFQYFNGYGETILKYKQKDEIFRAGLIL